MSVWPQLSVSARPGYVECFGCGQGNPIGLKLNFLRDGNGVSTEFTAGEKYQGWPGQVHGGILICLLDEAMYYAAAFEGITCVTADINAKLKRPAPINTPLVVTGTVTRKTRKLIESKATVSLKDGTIVAEGTCRQFVAGPERKESGGKAVIWDMDGVLVDTAQYHYRAWKKAFAERDVKFTEAIFRRQFGQRNDEIIREMLGSDVAQAVIEEIANKKETDYRDFVKDRVKALPGAMELLKGLRAHGFKVGLASSAPVENVEVVMSSLDAFRYFDVMVNGSDVTEGKPSPQCYLLVAQKLGVEPWNCVVFEDAVAGVTGAKKAGMQCIAVTNTSPRAKLGEADIIVDSLEEVSIADLERLLNSKNTVRSEK